MGNDPKPGFRWQKLSRQRLAGVKRRSLVAGVQCHEEGDAFSADSIARVEPKPNIAIVSGLYELFDSNEKLRTSLAGLAKALPMNGYLIYTNQPWHPQLDFIARVLPNRDGDPWVMRCRSQAEMDQLVAEAGFKKIDMRIDEWGIFTVSIAIKTEDS